MGRQNSTTSLTAAIRSKDKAAVSKRPESKGWAAKEVICHLRDAEESSMARFDVIMAINDPKLVGVNPDRRAEDDFLSLIAWHDDDHVDQLNRALDGRA